MAGLEEVKVGDLIFMENTAPQWSGPHVAYTLHEVSRITATQVIAGSRRFRKATGRIVGVGYGVAYPVTPEILAEHKKERLAYKKYHNAREILSRLEARIRKNELSNAYIDVLIANFAQLLEEKE